MLPPPHPGMRRSQQRKTSKITPKPAALLPGLPTGLRMASQQLSRWVPIGSVAHVPAFQEFADEVAICALLSTAGSIYYQGTRGEGIRNSFRMLLFSATVLLHAISVLSNAIRIIAAVCVNTKPTQTNTCQVIRRAAHSTGTSCLIYLLFSICCIVRGSLALMNKPSYTSPVPPSYDVVVMVGCVLGFCFIYMKNVERKVRSDQEVGGGTTRAGAAHNADDLTTPKERFAHSRHAKVRQTIIGMRQKATRLRRSTLNSLGRQTSSASVASASVAAIGHEGGVRILCFDGGGNRIAVALWILEHVEFIMGGPEWLSAYDVIGGISAGGLVAVMASDTKLLEPAISAHLGRPVWNRAADVREVLTQLMTLCFRTIRVCRRIWWITGRHMTGTLMVASAASFLVHPVLLS